MSRRSLYLLALLAPLAWTGCNTCNEPMLSCPGDVCVDPRVDSKNCGACGKVCAAGEVCTNGLCTLSCPTGLTVCKASCADLQTDRLNCGACGTACPDTQICVAGVCGCDKGLTACGAACRDTQTDPKNCGACTTACESGKVCSTGMCSLTCQTGLTNCSGSCRDLLTDAANCGACGTGCASGQACTMGKCAASCATGLTECSGVCRDLQTDRQNCGGCGIACSAGQACAMGKCEVTCQAGLENCSGSCRDLQTDASNCGTCGTKCESGQACKAGKCTVSCLKDFTDCNNVCVNTQSDNDNCGACGNKCKAGEVCGAGKCAASCGAPLQACSGACVDPRFDPTNCGTCGTKCTALPNSAPICVSGACSSGPCLTGFFDCDATSSNGCEIDGRSDAKNCGKCGGACTLAHASPTCKDSKCIIGGCDTDYFDCDGKPETGCEVNLKTDSKNCSKCGTVCDVGKVCSGGICVTLAGTGTSSDPFQSTPPKVNCKEYKTAYGDTAKNGFYVIAPLGSNVTTACDFTTAGGNWTRCFGLVNTSGEDLTNNEWMTPCVDWTMAAWASTDIMVKLSDTAGNVVYSTNGTRPSGWTYDQLTSTTDPGSQYYSPNHGRMVTFTNGDKMMIAGRNAGNSGCGGSMGTGYGITIYPSNPDYHSNPKMFVMTYVSRYSGYNFGSARNFSGWSPSHEISYNGGSFNSCSSTPSFLGTFEFFVR